MKHFGSSLLIEISPEFVKNYPSAAVGVLILENLSIKTEETGFKKIKNEILMGLQNQFPDLDSLKQHPVILAYSRYYKKFDKSYHVLGQLRSVIFEGHPLPSVSPLIEAIFAVELKNMLLTAFHDLETISFPLKIGIASGKESYLTLSGDEKLLKPTDMIVSDQTGVISSVIYGPDKRTRVTSSTSSILIVVYAPDGICRETIVSHFDDIENLIRRVTVDCKMTYRSIFPLC